MPLLKNNAFVADDYITVADEEALPSGGKLLVSFVRLQADWDAIAKHPALFGVRLSNTDKVEALQPYLSKIALVVLAFPSFTDGRSYSLARGLRMDVESACDRDGVALVLDEGEGRLLHP